MKEKAVIKLVEYLGELAPYEIWYRTNYVLRSPDLFPTQPEIDLVICHREKKDEKLPPIIAAEIKYIRTTRDGV